MKNLVMYAVTLLFWNIAFAQQCESLLIKQSPIVGQRWNIFYQPTTVSGRTVEDVQVSLYFYGRDGEIGQTAISLDKKEKIWQGYTRIPESASMVSLVFSSDKQGPKDNNDAKGYLVPITIDGKKIVPYAYAAMSSILAGGPPDAAALKKDHVRALDFMKKEIYLYPVHEAEFRSTYFNMLANSTGKEDKVELVKKLSALKSNREEDLMMAQLYLSYFGEQQQADSLDRLLRTRFPDGMYVRSKKEQGALASSVQEPAVTDNRIVTEKLDENQLAERVRADMIREPVAPLQLKDTDGNAVLLGGRTNRAKVVIIDFWATWCKPCIASFPAMQRMVDMYNDNEDVKFYFVATMERGDAKSNILEFLSKSDYDFSVLLDEKEEMNLFKAYTHYKGTGGIPYKLVLDGNGNVRYRSSGFSGDEEALRIELSTVISSLLREVR